ncbi:ferritin, chloroplastic-like [Teleopsis dalmanni]|uniref:ferritin, chloroplastic-like n=1 Tax=Teleopsis dalmanni TaxID=139649 RepID=UPI0018CE4878|nr:ferritin, chloroplastic-like [Teleopsis dalmanni]XP_037954666.1 ferritin, chloroplastic-like [Teleopsis dalmanni]
MQMFATILVFCLCAYVYANSHEPEGNCFISLEKTCSGKLPIYPNMVKNCNASLTNYTTTQVYDYVGDLLYSSYVYLYMTTSFRAQNYRPGFQKLYQELSDKHFDEAIDLIKHITERGGSINIMKLNAITKNYNEYHKDDELLSLGFALDIEKELFKEAADIHNGGEVKFHTFYKSVDPEIAHYFGEKFLGSQAETVRKLSGYVNDLFQIMHNGDKKELGVYMFDEYLQKQ